MLVAGCQTAPALQTPPAAGSAQAALATAPQLRQDAFDLIYEIVHVPQADAVFVATIDIADAQSAGFVHRLDARSLQVLQTIQIPRRAYGLGFNRVTGMLYVGNTKDGALTVVDATSGFVTGMIQLARPLKGTDGKASLANTRKVVVDEQHNRVFVTSPGKPGLVWIVDGATNAVTHTIISDGIWTAGAAYDAATNRLYVGQGGVNEVLVIDPDAGTIVQRLSTGETPAARADEPANFFINIALDAPGRRLFAAGGQKNQVYVLDLPSGQVVKRIPFTSGALDILYNPARGELVTTHRGNHEPGSGFVSIIDAANYTVKRSIDLPVHPNSLALSPDGQTLYVTVKAPYDEQHPAFRKDARDSVVRIDLAGGGH
ncbi:YncE family protein [Corticibacter populi]|uniref:YncE family protein n=1 Tax=Corticibacter populi TaxID=1550736 RepID=A0A3M6R0P4_9BURK|nr:YncE family protein [Corticibacter populi]